MFDAYGFVYRGVLTDVALAETLKSLRIDDGSLSSLEAEEIQTSLNFQLLEKERLQDAMLMSYVYIALHSLENTVRDFVIKQLSEKHGETWAEKVPKNVTDQAEKRKQDEEKIRWHTRREHSYLFWQFGDLAKIITVNWDAFQDVLPNQHWVNNLLGTLEVSRNVIMHGGVLERIDVERIGMSIRDWLRQVHG
jgi:hypothetical protein